MSISHIHQLEHLECCFKWNSSGWVNHYDPVTIINIVTDDMDENEDIEILGLLLITFLHTKTQPPNLINARFIAGKTLNKCKEHYDKDPETAIAYTLMALGNMANVMHLVLETGDAYDEVWKNLAELPGIDELSNKSKGIVVGCRAHGLVRHGPTKHDEAIHYLLEARKLDPDNYLWPFWVALTTARRRKLRWSDDASHRCPSDIEEVMFREAVALSGWKNPLAIVMLADTIGVKSLHIEEDEVQHQCKLEAKKYYMMAVDLAPDSVRILKTAGKGLGQVNEGQASEDCLMHALELRPENTTVLYTLGTLYEFCHSKMDLIKSEACYSAAVTSWKSRNVYAEMNLSRVRRKLDGNYDIMAHYRQMVPRYPNNKAVQELIAKNMEKFGRSTPRRPLYHSENNSRVSTSRGPTPRNWREREEPARIDSRPLPRNWRERQEPTGIDSRPMPRNWWEWKAPTGIDLKPALIEGVGIETNFSQQLLSDYFKHNPKQAEAEKDEDEKNTSEARSDTSSDWRVGIIASFGGRPYGEIQD